MWVLPITPPATAGRPASLSVSENPAQIATGYTFLRHPRRSKHRRRSLSRISDLSLKSFPASSEKLVKSRGTVSILPGVDAIDHARLYEATH